MINRNPLCLLPHGSNLVSDTSLLKTNEMSCVQEGKKSIVNDALVMFLKTYYWMCIVGYEVGQVCHSTWQLLAITPNSTVRSRNQIQVIRSPRWLYPSLWSSPESSEKKDQLRDCPGQTGLWECWCGVVLITDGYRRAQSQYHQGRGCWTVQGD